MTGSRPSWTIRLLVLSLLCGGLRDPRLFAAAGAAVGLLTWLERPSLGPAAAWLPWLAWAAASAALSASPLAALPELARWLAALGVASLAAAWGEREREEWLKAFLVTATVLAVAALWTGAATGGYFRNAMTGLMPPYYNYTAFALAAAAAAGAAWALHPRGPRGRARTAALAVAALSVVCVLLARSRGATLGLAAAAAVWALRRWGKRAAWALVLTAAAASALVAFSPALRGLATKAQRARGEARPGIWRAAARVAGESPFFGEGPGQFGAGFRRHPVPVPSAAAQWGLSTDYAHSEILQAAAETGWAGLVLWLLAGAATLSVLLGASTAEPAREAAAVAAAAMAAQFLVDDFLQIPGLLFLFLTALSVAGAPPFVTRRWPRWAAALLAVLALTAWVPRSLVEGRPDRAFILFPTDVGAVEDFAYRSALTGVGAQFTDALWARAERLAPYDAVYPWRRAQLAAARRDWSVAEADAGRAIASEPGFLRARLERARAMVELRERGAAAETAEIRRRLAAGPPGVTENGYERVVSGFDDADRAELARVEAAARGL
jgi:O-antigen ligase